MSWIRKIPLIGVPIISAVDFENRIITNQSFKNNSRSFLQGVFLYTEEDKNLAKYVRENYQSLNLQTGVWCDVYVLEKPVPNRKALREYWLPLLKARLYETWSLYRWITNTKPFDKNESYKIADKLGVLPGQFPCLVLLPPLRELSSEEKLIIPIREVSTLYFRRLFSVLKSIYLKSIINHSEEMNKYEEIKINFETIIQYLEENSQQTSRQSITEYRIDGTNIFVNSQVRKIDMNEEKNTFNFEESIIGSVTGEGKIGTAITHQHNYSAEGKQTLAEAAKEIQDLLAQLSKTYPNQTTAEQMKIATQAIERIESDPDWKQRAIKALKAGVFESLKTNPVGAFVVGAIEGWEKTEEKT